MRQADERVVGWKAIAHELGVSEWDAKHAFYRAGLRLAKLTPGRRTSTVYVLRGVLEALRAQLFRAKLDKA